MSDSARRPHEFGHPGHQEVEQGHTFVCHTTDPGHEDHDQNDDHFVVHRWDSRLWRGRPAPAERTSHGHRMARVRRTVTYGPWVLDPDPEGDPA